MDLSNKTIIISRTDSIGDVILTLPMCAWIKEQFPNCKLLFLGKKYTKPVVDCFKAVDDFLTLDSLDKLPVPARIQKIKSWNADVFIHVFPNKELAKMVKKAGVPIRIGTSHRSYHLLTCNYKVNFSRKSANEHESQLNFHLLKPIGCKVLPSLDELSAYFELFKPNKQEFSFEKLNTNLKKVVLHPKSKGSALEWEMDNFVKLAKELANRNCLVFFSGTEQEGASFRGKIPTNKNIIDISGKFSLDEFIVFLNEVDALVACSTGPLHLAAILGKKAIGLYTGQRPMHPGRWKPVGKHVEIISDNSKVNAKSNKKHYLNISVNEVLNKVIKRE